MSTELALGFDDLDVLEEDGIEVFVLNMNESPDVPPYYVDVAGRRFSYSGVTFLVRGHSAALPGFVRDHEAAGRLTLMVERNSRYIAYVYDPTAIAEDDDEA